MKVPAVLKRWRPWAILVLPVMVILLSCVGPDSWREPLVRLQYASWTAIALALAHSGGTALFDYARGHAAYTEALKHPIGAGMVFLGLCFVRAVLCLAFTFAIFAGQARAAELPPGAIALAPVVNAQLDDYWPEIPRRSYIGALIEKESCITLTHKKCWTTLAQLKTSREEGASLGQLTRAYDKNGNIRFDALAETRAMDPKGLADLNWQTVYTRADLSVRAILVKVRNCDTYFKKLDVKDELVRLAFCDAAYNGGLGGVGQDRKLCYLTKGCDANQWFDHVENYSTKSKEKWQGYGQSAFDINRAHVRATIPLEPRRVRYIALLGI